MERTFFFCLFSRLISNDTFTVGFDTGHGI